MGVLVICVLVFTVFFVLFRLYTFILICFVWHRVTTLLQQVVVVAVMMMIMMMIIIIIIIIIQTADTHVNKRQNMHFHLYPLQSAYINI